MTQAIAMKNVTKRYGNRTAVSDVSLSINRGELFALLGVNGAGKTTLIKMLSCLTAPSSGDAFILGKSIVSNPHLVKKYIAVSPQETAIAPNLTVRENLALMASSHHLSKKESWKKIIEIIQQFSLSNIQNQRSKTLSGGWKRRLSIAMALISEPDILFLDEPTLGLDILARQELWKVIRKSKGKTTIILTTHYLEEAKSLADRICIMKSGEIKALGTVEQLLQQTNTTEFDDAFIQIVTEGGLS